MSDSRFNCFAAIDYRYWEVELAPYLSENASTKAKLLVELSLVNTLNDFELCPKNVVSDIKQATQQVTTEEVYAEEKITRHDIKALVNCIKKYLKLNDSIPFVHKGLTSFDTIDSANAYRYKQAMNNVVIPGLKELLQLLIILSIKYAHLPQVGRTHGQHASPVTFGNTIAGYVSRLGSSILHLEENTSNIVGKISGAVGCYNGLSLIVDNPIELEKNVLSQLDLQPAQFSSQIAPPGPLYRIASELVNTCGILANIARDMRNLQRTEIGEIGEKFIKGQVGSSTMPHKKNPINFENVESVFKIVKGKFITVMDDVISEHQRDLTGSASGRTYGEIIAYAFHAVKRLKRTLSKLEVNTDRIADNLNLQNGVIGAEPLYILLAEQGHPRAHEAAKEFALKCYETGFSFEDIVKSNSEIGMYLEKMTEYQLSCIFDPTNYTGLAEKQAKVIGQQWKDIFNL